MTVIVVCRIRLELTKFVGAKLTDVRLNTTDLRNTIFDNGIFDGALMDKLTYAALKGMEADLSKVIVR
ncbi:pentapeptide repeat-containing protein [Paenibacillus macquariensis]|uniref:Pentapeptide repeat-containing protein n=1 Tax=Paenibacillus macquariensis TaxID=948756 RepID=A0ABY1KCD7_9BACL|nr:hypothetical protein PMSM_16030 [Paenibacillus macquariensis subsp. macquariensis]SIR59357.1 Pentapeptide repeat-containing protein [Paenibacillus macquariensis]